jgi:hypothetical protein
MYCGFGYTTANDILPPSRSTAPQPLGLGPMTFTLSTTGGVLSSLGSAVSWYYQNVDPLGRTFFGTLDRDGGRMSLAVV